MSYPTLIRLGGLGPMVVGVVYAVVSILASPFPRNLLTGVWEVIYVLFLLSVLAVMVALHLLQRGRYGRKGGLAFVTALVGGALIPSSHISMYLPNYGGGVLGIATDALLLSVGMLVATVGIVALGIFTLKARVVPRWCGWALIAGNPLLGVVLFFLGMDFLYGPWAVAVPWVVVGFATFRAAGRMLELPSRVR